METVMSEPLKAPSVMFMAGLIHSSGECLEAAEEALVESFGRVALVSGEYPFELSDYYAEEMGPGLRRNWLAFQRLVDPSRLPAWKHECHAIEVRLSRDDGSRPVNIDPGYLDFGKLVLASFKEAPDKVYMGDGVWAHTCLRYGHGEFSAPDHSFPDFRDGRFDGFMLEARRTFRRILRSAGDGDL